MSAKCGELGCAKEVFDRMVKRNLISWTTMIGAYAGIGQGEKPFDLFLQMQREDLGLNVITYLSILNPDASAGALGWLNKVHCQALKAGLESDVRVGSALVQTYAKSGSIDDARHVFDRMRNRDVMSWTVMIGGHAQHGYGQEALQLFAHHSPIPANHHDRSKGTTEATPPTSLNASQCCKSPKYHQRPVSHASTEHLHEKKLKNCATTPQVQFLQQSRPPQTSGKRHRPQARTLTNAAKPPDIKNRYQQPVLQGLNRAHTRKKTEKLCNHTTGPIPANNYDSSRPTMEATSPTS